ncbi:MAG: 30S ribosomal protein S17 [Candidatus Glassbacteria bacterium RIFCSPLOWO2_12_FULL_58_11]|uniref:Small ribosomal subunit protein uS17 n=1 Tax=Candidatus Glassbacteria bacterium RIFCSPLOWO2_12_FULL_58_11 TaxID=1817867 RepID=A0A1F5YP77_9BACT|nr:ribosomal protein S17 [uncultured bacterium]OGG01999.1 MAG: 30S ribosomal protein S17 [Candidatus Glassbacteria bacterium RIFCSPLOWO2_12_FULL_58_11]
MERNNRKSRVGVVVGDKMHKTILVRVDRQIMHPIYGKAIRRSKKYVAHDEKNECKVGNTVRIVETRPLSKTKHWRVVEVLSTGEE